MRMNNFSNEFNTQSSHIKNWESNIYYDNQLFFLRWKIIYVYIFTIQKCINITRTISNKKSLAKHSTKPMILFSTIREGENDDLNEFHRYTVRGCFDCQVPAFLNPNWSLKQNSHSTELSPPSFPTSARRPKRPVNSTSQRNIEKLKLKPHRVPPGESRFHFSVRWSALPDGI